MGIIETHTKTHAWYLTSDHLKDAKGKALYLQDVEDMPGTGAEASVFNEIHNEWWRAKVFLLKDSARYFAACFRCKMHEIKDLDAYRNRVIKAGGTLEVKTPKPAKKKEEKSRHIPTSNKCKEISCKYCHIIIMQTNWQQQLCPECQKHRSKLAKEARIAAEKSGQ